MPRKDTRLKAELKELGKRILFLRTEKKLSQIQFAELAGISNKQLCNIEKGYNWPSLPAYIGICRAAGLEDIALIQPYVTRV